MYYFWGLFAIFSHLCICIGIWKLLVSLNIGIVDSLVSLPPLIICCNYEVSSMAVALRQHTHPCTCFLHRTECILPLSTFNSLCHLEETVMEWNFCCQHCFFYLFFWMYWCHSSMHRVAKWVTFFRVWTMLADWQLEHYQGLNGHSRLNNQ